MWREREESEREMYCGKLAYVMMGAGEVRPKPVRRAGWKRLGRSESRVYRQKLFSFRETSVLFFKHFN